MRIQYVYSGSYNVSKYKINRIYVPIAIVMNNY